MKRLISIFFLAMGCMMANANEIRYFTFSQANRTTSYLNQQNELMIYCGYEHELETYAIVSDVWMEQVNSKYYEIWLYAFDAYTGEEIYMPLDLGCIWVRSGNRMYSAATYLRFRNNKPLPYFAWVMPPYNNFTRRPHFHGCQITYHYHVHCHGWVPPSMAGHYNHPHDIHYHPYYHRHHRNDPPPMPHGHWTPGVSTPVYVGLNIHYNVSYVPQGSTVRVGGTNTRGDGSANVNNGSRGSSSNGRPSGTSTSGTNNSRGTSATGTTTNSRGTGNVSSGNSRSTSTTGTTTNSRGTGNVSSGNSRNTSTTGTTNSRGTGNVSSGNSRGTSATGTTTNSRSTSTTAKPSTTSRSATSSVSRPVNNTAATR